MGCLFLERRFISSCQEFTDVKGQCLANLAQIPVRIHHKMDEKSEKGEKVIRLGRTAVFKRFLDGREQKESYT